MALPPGTYPIGGPIVPTAGARLPATQELHDTGVLLPEGGKWYHVIAGTDPNAPWVWAPVAQSSGLPTGYPANGANLRTLILQGMVYPHLFRVRAMRITWKDVVDIDADPFTAADFTGSNSTVGESSGLTWAVAGEPTVWVGIWISGNFAAARLTGTLNNLGWLDRSPTGQWGDGVDLTINNVAGLKYTSQSSYYKLTGGIARAILDPGPPA